MNAFVAAENKTADTVFFEIEYITLDAVGEFDKIACHGARQPVHLGDAIADLKNDTGLDGLEFGRKVFDFAPENGDNFI